MADNLALRLAQRRVHSYADEVLQHHAHAMECRDCELFLQKGIDAHRWLSQAEETMRESDAEGIFSFSREMQDALGTLYQTWLGPCAFAEQWIDDLLKRNFHPDNLEDFRRVCDEVRDIVERQDWQTRTRKSRIIHHAEESW